MTTDSNGYAGGSSGRVTMKDVYDIVGRLETKVDGLNSTVQSVTVAHEHRLTERETEARATDARVEKLEGRVDTLRDEHNQAKGHVRAVAWALGAVGTLVCGVGGLGIAHALHW